MAHLIVSNNSLRCRRLTGSFGFQIPTTDYGVLELELRAASNPVKMKILGEECILNAYGCILAIM